MPIVVVPQSADPGVLDNTTLIGLEAICNVGSRAGVEDGSVSAWVQVCIIPFGDVSRDSFGRYLHVCIEFTQPPEWIGKRRRQVPSFFYNDGPSSMFIECDPGWFWVGSWARFNATGGVAGDRYLVTMTTATMQQEADARLSRDDSPFYQVDVFEPPCKFKLTSVSGGDAAGPIKIANYQSEFKLAEGTGTYGGSPIVGETIWLPLNAPISVDPGSIYKTRGAV